jgi:hypothetical protein
LTNQKQEWHVAAMFINGCTSFFVIPASSITKTDRHDIAEILLKVILKHNKSNQIKITQP